MRVDWEVCQEGTQATFQWSMLSLSSIDTVHYTVGRNMLRTIAVCGNRCPLTLLTCQLFLSFFLEFDLFVSVDSLANYHVTCMYTLLNS